MILALALLFYFIFWKEVGKAQESIGFNGEVKQTILEIILFWDKQLGKEGFLEPEDRFDLLLLLHWIFLSPH